MSALAPGMYSSGLSMPPSLPLTLLSRELYRDALEALASLPDAPLVLWKRGTALHGLNRHDEALAVLELACGQLQHSDKALCGIDLALTLIKASRLADATARIATCRSAFAGDPAGLAICDLLELAARQRAGDHQAFLAAYRPLCARLGALDQPAWAVHGLSLAALAHRALGDFTAGEALASETLPEAQRLNLTYRQAHLLYTLAVCRQELGDSDGAAERIAQARALCERSGGALLLADIVLLEGIIETVRGRHAEAIRAFAQAEAIYLPLAYASGAAQAQISRGTVHFIRGELQAAGAAFRAAMATATRFQALQMLGIAELNLGAVYTSLSEYATAKDLFLQALAHFEAVGATTSMAQAAAFAAAVCPGNEFDALVLRAEDALRRCGPSLHRSVAQRVLAEHLALRGRHAEARAHLREAEAVYAGPTEQWAMTAVRAVECDLALLDAPQPPSSPADLSAKLIRISAAAARLPDVAARASLALAGLAQRAGEHARALGHMAEAVAALRTLRHSGDDPVLASLAARALDPLYWQGARLAHALGDGEALLAFVEQRRAQWLARSLSAQEDGPRPAIAAQTPPAISERYADLDAAAMFAPARADLRQPAPPLGLAALRDAFTRAHDQAWAAILLEPLAADGSDWLLGRLSPAGFTHRRLSAGALIRAMLRALAEGDAAFRRGFFGQSASSTLQRLADWLGVGNWLPDGETPTLILADAAWLSRLPFAALPLPEGGSLGDRAILRYAPSLAIAATSLGMDSAPATRALVVAPLAFEGRHPALPASQAEAARVAELWPGAISLVGENATLGALRALRDSGALARVDLLYLGTHAASDPARIRLSALALRDGDLTLQELLSWRLSARLVCLSACDSAFAVSWGGEERVGIETALLAAGARNILSARWPVEDGATTEIMGVFLRRYAGHGDAGLALFETRRALAGSVAASDLAAWRVMGGG